VISGYRRIKKVRNEHVPTKKPSEKLEWFNISD